MAQPSLLLRRAGGFKLWECSLDLAAWLWDNTRQPASSPTAQLTSQPWVQSAPPSSSPAEASGRFEQVLQRTQGPAQPPPKRSKRSMQTPQHAQHSAELHAGQHAGQQAEQQVAAPEVPKAAAVDALRHKLHSLAGCRVLELGCGHGLPGITAALLGAEVHFQVRSTVPYACTQVLLVMPFRALSLYAALCQLMQHS